MREAIAAAIGIISAILAIVLSRVYYRKRTKAPQGADVIAAIYAASSNIISAIYAATYTAMGIEIGVLTAIMLVLLGG